MSDVEHSTVYYNGEKVDEKKSPYVHEGRTSDEEVAGTVSEIDLSQTYDTEEHDAFVDPRLKDYPIPLVAKTVDLKNDPTEPILTFRFWFLSTLFVGLGCAVSTFFYFKPFAASITSYAVQLLAWGAGDAMARYLPTREYSTFGRKWSLNPGPWNAKEHALIVVAYWGSCYTAYGLGPLSALELWYGKKISAIWGILFLLTSQMIGYGFCGIFRDNLVRPPSMYYPGVLPNVSLFNAMHKSPTAARAALKFFGIVAIAAFCYEWLPQLMFPLLASLPLLCYMGHGNPIAYVLGSGSYGFGMLTASLDWNYISTLQPLYTPLWSNMTQAAGVVFAVWLLYPILYYKNVWNAQNFGAMSSQTYAADGTRFNASMILNPDFTVNETAFEIYGAPQWAPSYVFYFFFGFAASTGAMLYAVLWHGPEMWKALRLMFQGKQDTDDYNDPYLKLMSIHPRVPQWWYLALLGICGALSLGTIYGGGFQLPWWGFIVMSLIAFVFTWPNGVWWAVANQQVGMSFLAEVISGALFPGKPIAVLTSLTYTRQILEQNLNLISDYKFGFYMKIPEKEMFIGQVWGTLLGPFINFGLMQVVLGSIDHDELKGIVPSVQWNAVLTRNYYSLSLLWGAIGPKRLFGNGSQYSFLYYGFFLGPAVVAVVYMLQRWKPKWNLEKFANFPLFCYGVTLFPVFQMTNFTMGVIFSIVFMGVVYRKYPVWWRKYNYLLGVGLDCGTQLMGLALVLFIALPNVSFPAWWGNNDNAYDLCFAPADSFPGMQN